MIIHLMLWSLIFSVLLFAWVIAAIQLRRHHRSLSVAALLFGRLFFPVFLISLTLRYLILFRLIDKLSVLQATAGQPQVVGQTPYQYFFTFIVNQPLVQQFLPNVAQEIGWISLLFMATLTAVVSFFVVLLYPKSSPSSWSKSLLPDSMRWFLLLGIAASIYFLTNQNFGTLMVTQDIFDLYGMLPILSFQFFIWTFGDFPEQENTAEDTEEETDAVKKQMAALRQTVGGSDTPRPLKGHTRLKAHGLNPVATAAACAAATREKSTRTSRHVVWLP